MSEEFFNQIADELRSQQTSPAAPVTPEAEVTPVASIPEPITEPNPEPITEPIVPEGSEKEWWDTQDDTNQPAVNNTEKKAEDNKVAEELDSDLKLLIEYKKSGKTLADFVKEYQVEDYTKMTEEQIVKKGLKEVYNLADDQIETAFYEFEGSSIFQKKQMLDAIKQKFEQVNAEKLKQLTSGNEQTEAQAKAVFEQYNKELDAYSQNIVNKEMYGLKITDEMSKNLKDYINTEFTLTKADGTFDIEKVYSLALWMKHGKDLVKANITKAKNEGREQVIKEVSNPSRNNTFGGRAVGSGLEAAQEAFIAMFPG
jgi:hypothetical protein